MHETYQLTHFFLQKILPRCIVTLVLNTYTHKHIFNFKLSPLNRVKPIKFRGRKMT